MTKKLTAKEKLLQRAGNVSKKKTNEATVTALKKIEISHKFNLDLCDDTKINSFLNERSDQLYSNEVNSNIIAGEILTEVYNELAGNNRYDGLYVEWLRAINYSPRTALRHRVRYALYSNGKTDESKELFATLPVRLLEKLHMAENKEFLISSVNSGDISSKKELEGMLMSLPLNEESSTSVVIPLEFSNEYKAFTKKVRSIDLASLSEEERGKVHRLISSFNEIIEKNATNRKK